MTPPGLAAKVDVVAVAGATVDEITAAAAPGELEATGAQVVDLVPADLPAERALRLLRRLEPDRLGTDPFYSPGGAHEAVALDPSVADRMAGGPAGDGPLDRAALVRVTLRAQRHAPTAALVRVAPRLRATPTGPEDAWRELEQRTAYSRPYGALHPLLVAAEAAHLAAMTAGLAVAPLAAAAALVSWSAQPALVFAGPVPLRPPGVASGGLSRLPRAWAANARLVRAGRRATRDRDAERRATPPPAPPGSRPAVRAPARHLLLVRVEHPGRPARRHRPAAAQARPLPPGRVPGLRARLPEPGADPGRARLLLRRRLRRAGRGAGRDQLAALGKIYRRRVETLARFTERGPGWTWAPGTPTSCWRPAGAGPRPRSTPWT